MAGVGGRGDEAVRCVEMGMWEVTRDREVDGWMDEWMEGVRR